MAILIPEEAASNWVDNDILALLNTDNVVTLYLFDNDLTPIYSTGLGSFADATFDGYASVVVDDFVDAGNDGGARIVQGTLTREFTLASLSAGTADIYGYFVVGYPIGFLWCERFTGAPITLDTPGQAIRIRPRLLVGNC